MNIEVLITYKKVLISFFIVFLSSMRTNISALNITMIIVITFLGQVREQFYFSKNLNQFESVCSLVQILTLFLGLFFTQEKGITKLSQVATYILLLAAYVSLVVLFYLRIRVETLKWIF